METIEKYEATGLSKSEVNKVKKNAELLNLVDKNTKYVSPEIFALLTGIKRNAVYMRITHNRLPEEHLLRSKSNKRILIHIDELRRIKDFYPAVRTFLVDRELI